MKTEPTVRKDQIIEAAIKRFAHFGIAKTSLTEVADDLGVAKQTLSYYFSDKKALVTAVVDKLGEEYEEKLHAEIDQADTVEKALLKLTEVKSWFFEKYFMLLTQENHMELATAGVLPGRRNKLMNRELALMKALLDQGVSKGELRPMDSAKKASLLLETLYAFARCVKDKSALPDKEAFQQVLTRQKEVTRIFYDSLKSDTWKN